MYQQNYNYQQSQYRPQPTTSSMPMMFGLKGRPVASLEEARASVIDFDGSIFYFPDIANRKVYTKQINMDGTLSLNVYELVEAPVQPTEEINPNLFITREEFDNTINQLKALLTPAAAPVNANAEPPVRQDFDMKF